MLSIMIISALFITTDVSASKAKVLCLTPEASYVYTEEDKIYTISEPNDLFYTDRIEDGYVYLSGDKLRVRLEDVVVGNDVVRYLKKSSIQPVAKIVVDSAEIKPIGKKNVIAEVEEGVAFAVEGISKYSVKIMYNEELCYLRRSNVHIQYYLHNLEIPEYRICDISPVITELDAAIQSLSEVNNDVTQLLRNSDVRNAITDYAVSFVGNDYIWGGTNPYTGADCSGFVQFVYRHFGYNIPRCSFEQCDVGDLVDKSSAQPGDLLFFWKNSLGRVGHVAMYLGNNKMVEAQSESTGIVISDVDWNEVYLARSYIRS